MTCSIWEAQKDDRLNTDKLDTKTVFETQKVFSVVCISFLCCITNCQIFGVFDSLIISTGQESNNHKFGPSAKIGVLTGHHSCLES